ncbi:hypothetical protein T07_13265 [Trichinella nelsoni]|uniref:Uncharacterized protein n=1 Tax=Trichinella nelsoni TaxID=6336 RepID=A0A0V0RZ45_9BILA|nr:hypothetical protein T07_13265 [Trichinella nelsoni]
MRNKSVTRYGIFTEYVTKGRSYAMTCSPGVISEQRLTRAQHNQILILCDWVLSPTVDALVNKLESRKRRSAEAREVKDFPQECPGTENPTGRRAKKQSASLRDATVGCARKNINAA